MSLTKATFSMISGAVANVLDFGAVADGVTDDTAAFNAAIATGKRVFVPAGTYSVADIGVVSNMEIEGEEEINSSSILLVRTNNSGAFRHSAASDAQQVTISNLTIKAAPGVTGARAYLQDDKSIYLAYAKFSGIETWRELEIAYDGFFIFTSWEKCRDGYSGSAVSGQTHQFIKSVPAAYGQTRQTNLNQVLKSQAFRSDATNGAVDIQYGVNWTFRDTDFETLSTRAAYLRGVFNVRFESCWFEGVASTDVVNVGTSTAPNPQGTYPVTFENCHAYMSLTTARFLTGSGAYSYSVLRCTFANIPSGVVLGSKNPEDLDGNFALSGVGSSGFFAGFKSATDSTIISNSQFEDSCIPMTTSQQINVLPIGPSGLGASNFTVQDTGSGTASLADVASSLGLAGNAIVLTMTDAANWFYYQMPAKLVSWLAGKTVTFVVSGYGDGSAVVSDGLFASIWVDAVPTYANAAASSSSLINVASQNLDSVSATYAVPSTATSMYVGCGVGGSNVGDKVVIELMSLLLGSQTPAISKLN